MQRIMIGYFSVNVGIEADVDVMWHKCLVYDDGTAEEHYGRWCR